MTESRGLARPSALRLLAGSARMGALIQPDENLAARLDLQQRHHRSQFQCRRQPQP
jgi:hypothetical protein